MCAHFELVPGNTVVPSVDINWINNPIHGGSPWLVASVCVCVCVCVSACMCVVADSDVMVHLHSSNAQSC